MRKDYTFYQDTAMLLCLPRMYCIPLLVAREQL